MTTGLLFALLGLATGTFGLILQFVITLPASMAAGRSLAGSIIFFFSFFTVLTNIAAVLVHTATLAGRPHFFARPIVQNAIAVAITVVSLVYAVVLARLWTPQGWFYLADLTLHYVAPALYLAWWLTGRRDGQARWHDIPYWLAYPLAYLAYVMARAPIAGEVPYPFLDVSGDGVASVAVASLSMLALFLVVSTLVVLADRALSRFTGREDISNRTGG